MLDLTNRRQFLKASAAAGVGVWVASRAGPARSQPPSEKVRIACVGTGGKGENDSADAGRSGVVVAVCDVDEDRLDGAGKRFKGANKYTDFRKMLEEMENQIDAVTVSTPDHCHAAAAALAMKMGKHCFVQSPLTHTVYEARRLGELAREKNVATQMGNQFTAYPPLRKAAALLRAGMLGNVKEVHVWTNRPLWPQGIVRPRPDPVPKTLNWDLWIGPAAFRPYTTAVYHPLRWRGWWDFGTGALGDMGCHTANMPYMGLGLRDPTTVQATTSGHDRDSFPNWSIVKFEFPANDWRPGLVLWWHDGGKQPSQELFDAELLQNQEGKPTPMKQSGCLVIGEKGKMYAPGDYAEQGLRVSNGLTEPKVEYPESPGHFEEWIGAIKGGPPAASSFPDYAGPLAETILLGNLAVWAAPKADQEGKKIQWDAKNLKAANAPEVEGVIRATYRKGYSL